MPDDGPVLRQKDLLTGRWRTVKAPAPSEVQVQAALVRHLQFRARPDLVYFHVPNGELRDKRAAAKLKAMGVLPGVSDLVFVWYDYAADRLKNLYLELKTRGRKQSAEQQDFAAAIAAVHADYVCVHNLDAALDTLKQLGLLQR